MFTLPGIRITPATTTFNCAVLGSQPRTLSIAASARFEGRPHLTCDSDNRLWIAYEEGDEQWGKDYLSTKEFAKVGFAKNPGFALYINRTVRVKCLVDGVLKQPAGSLQTAFDESLPFNRSLPRLAVDRSARCGYLCVTARRAIQARSELKDSKASRTAKCGIVLRCVTMASSGASRATWPVPAT